MERLSKEKSTILGFIKASEETDGLKRTMMEYEAELRGLKNQEVTIQRLREELADARILTATNAAQSSREANAEVTAVLKQWHEREAVVARETAESRAAQERQQNLVAVLEAQLASTRSKLEELEVQREHEMDDLIEELDTQRLKIATLEQQIASLTQVSDVSARTELSWLTSSAMLPTPDVTPIREAPAGPSVTPVRDPKAKHVAAELEAKLFEMERRDVAAQQLIRSLESRIPPLLDQIRVLSQRNSELELASTNDKEEVMLVRAELTAARSQCKVLESEKLSLHASIQHLEKELKRAESKVDEARPNPQFTLESLLTENVSTTATTATNKPAGTSDGLNVGDDFLAVAAQRDRLRQRLLTLEEASAAQIHALQVEVRRLEDDNARNVALTRAIHIDTTVDEVDHRPAAPMWSTLSTQMPLKERVIVILDRSFSLASKYIVPNLQLRRCVTAYLILLHAFMLLSWLL